MLMRTDLIIFTFEPLCTGCAQERYDFEEELPSMIETTIYGIQESGWPQCPDCEEYLTIHDKCVINLDGGNSNDEEL